MSHLIKQAEELAKQRTGGQVPVGLEQKDPITVIHMVPVLLIPGGTVIVMLSVLLGKQVQEVAWFLHS
jgi:hypothetical protein